MQLATSMSFSAFLVLSGCYFAADATQHQLYQAKSCVYQDMYKVGNLKTMRVRSITECVIQCSFHNSKCQSGFFKSKKKVCQLFNVTLRNVTVRDSNENIYFENTTLLTGERKFVDEVFTELLSFYHSQNITTWDGCLSLCESDQSCVAVSYDKNTSTCFLSDQPKMLNYTKQAERLCSVKKIYSNDVQVYAFSTRLEEDKNASMSITFDANFPASKAIDGIYVPSDHGLSEPGNMAYNAKRELSPWIQVDLFTGHYVDGVKIWDRSESPTPEDNDRLANVRVTVGETDTNFADPPEDEICDYLPGQPPADIFLVTCHTRMYGRYVRVTAVEVDEYFNIYELEIHGLKLL